MESVRYITGGLNTDDAPELLPQGDYSYANNLVRWNNEGGNGMVEPIRGTRNLSYPGDNNHNCIGVIAAPQANAWFLFYADTDANDDMIVKFEEGGTVTTLATSSIFNFSTSYPINGGGLVGDLLYFTDGYNPPRVYNINSGNPSTAEEILLIKRGPLYAPGVAKATGSGDVANREFQFAYQYEYDDGQLSVTSPHSLLVRKNSEGDEYGKITVSFPTESLPSNVAKVNILVREGNTGNWYIWKTQDDLTSVDFRNRSSRQILSRRYDLGFEPVPLTAKTMEVAKDKLWLGNYTEGYDSPSSINLSVGTTQASGNVSCSNNSAYQIGILFGDGQGRRCGVVTNDNCKLNLTGVSTTIANTYYNLTWSLGDHLNIPSWAETYSIVVTKALNKSYFIEHVSTKMRYARYGLDGNLYFADDRTTIWFSYVNTHPYLAISMTGLVNSGQGYDYVEGDRVAIFDHTEGSGYEEKVWYGDVVGIDGDWLLVDSFSFTKSVVDGDDYPDVTRTDNLRFQIYTPITDEEMIFYEIGTYAISGGSFSTTSGTWEGDTYIKATTYQAFTSFNNDTGGTGAYNVNGTSVSSISRKIEGDTLWDTDHGKAYVIDPIGQTVKENWVKHSQNSITDTAINGFSEFNVNDAQPLPVENGALQKLILGDRAQTDGSLLLAIGQTNTASIYIGEVTMRSSGDTSFMVTSDDVIGDIRTMKNGYGTQHPESVLKYRGSIYWYDHSNRAFLRHSANGTFPISDNKCKKAFETLAATANLEEVRTAYDPYYDMIYVTFKGTSAYNGITYHVPSDRWISYHNIQADRMFAESERMIIAKLGTIYGSDGTQYNNFLGGGHNLQIRVPLNDDPHASKEWNVFKVYMDDSLLEWSSGDKVFDSQVNRFDVVITNKHGQSVTLEAGDFEFEENIGYAPIFMDENSPGGLLDGDPIISNAIEAELTVSVYSMSYPYFSISYFGAGYDKNDGHIL